MNILQLADPTVRSTSYRMFVEQVCSARPASGYYGCCGPITVDFDTYVLLESDYGPLTAAAFSTVILNLANTKSCYKPLVRTPEVPMRIHDHHLHEEYPRLHAFYEPFFGFSALAMFAKLANPPKEEVQTLASSIKELLDKSKIKPRFEGELLKVGPNFQRVMADPDTFLKKSLEFNVTDLRDYHREWVGNVGVAVY
jgi:hypothetical protein